VRDGSQIGYSFSLNQSNQAEGIKKSFLIGFTFPEGRMLKEYALTVLNNYFMDCIEASQFAGNNNDSSKKTQEKVESKGSKTDNTPDIDLDVPF
jgi:hypothetical protein